MNKAVFLDRDGVLVEDNGYVHRIENFRIIQNVIEGLKKISKEYALFIVTNQSGISRGVYTQKDFEKFQSHLISELEKNGIKIKKTYHCPHTPEEKCVCRKPSTKFLEEAAREFEHIQQI